MPSGYAYRLISPLRTTEKHLCPFFCRQVKLSFRVQPYSAARYFLFLILYIYADIVYNEYIKPTGGKKWETEKI